MVPWYIEEKRRVRKWRADNTKYVEGLRYSSPEDLAKMMDQLLTSTKK